MQLTFSQPASVVAQAVPLDQEAQLDLFCHDVKSAAISCAQLLSGYHAVAHNSRFKLPFDLVDAAPAYPYSFKILEGSSLVRSLSPATRSGLKGLTYYLGRARDEAARLAEARPPGGVVCASDFATAIEVTSAAACFAKLAVADVLSIERRRRRAFEIAQWSYLVALLDEVIEGRGPLWLDGRILEVRSDFRLRERRVNIVAVALVILQQRQEQVVVTNLSRGGLGFKSPASFTPGQTVDIRFLEPERHFVGEIVWRVGLNAGVRFAKDLPDDDPLLVSLLATGDGEDKTDSAAV